MQSLLTGAKRGDKDTRVRASGLDVLGIPLSLEPMEARTASKLPEGAGWQFEPKWDGFRCLAFRAGDEVEIRAKSGKSLSRFFPEVVANLRTLSLSSFVVDGELVLAAHPSVALSAVGRLPDPVKGEIAKAYVILKEGAKADAEALMAHRRANLAAYKLPRKIQFVSDLPRTSSGKIMRRELATIDDELEAVAG